MKHILSVVFLCIFSINSYAQYEGWTGPNDLVSGSFHVGMNLGAGIATKYNYDVAASGEMDIYFPVHHAFYIGAMLQYQMYSIYYQKTSPEAAFSEGYAGYSLLDQNSYFFFAPQIIIPFGPKRFPNMFAAYIDGGVGMLMSGKETTHKWDSSYNFPLNAISNYDSTIITTKNIYSMIYRYGFGLVEQTPNRNYHMYFTFTEDISFVAGDLSSSSTISSPSRTAYSPKKISPVFFSFKVGVNFFHKKKK